MTTVRSLFRSIWKTSSTSVTAAAGLIAAASLASRLLGVFRDRVLAAQFGAGDVLDVYYTAFRLPDLVYNLIIAGALTAGFIPVFLSLKGRNKEVRRWELTNTVITVAGVVLVVVSGVLVLFTDKLVPIVAAGFSGAKLELAVTLTRIIFLSPILLGLSGIFGAVLQSYRQFFVFALAPIFYNVGIIVGALFFAPLFGPVALAWGVVLGALFHLGVQLPAVYRLGWRWRMRWNLRDKNVRLIGRLMLPRTMALSAQQLNILLLTLLASFLSSGSVAIFNLASNLYFVPVALFGISYAIAAFPKLSEKADGSDQAGVRQTLSDALRHILFFMVPMTVLFILLRAQIVRTILGSGAFDWTDTVLTFQTLLWFSLSLFPQAIIPLLARGFYAFKNTVLPFVLALIADIITIAISVSLGFRFGVEGLAMAFSIGAVVHAASLWIALNAKLEGLNELAIIGSLWRMLVAAGLMAFVIQGVKQGIGELIGTSTFLDVLVQGGISALAGIVTYVAALLLLQSRELDELLGGLRGRRGVIAESIDESEGL